MDHLAFIFITLIISTSQAADPTWTNLHAAVSLSENTATGTSIYRIEATDSDGDTLSYTQISGTSEFELIGQDVKTILSPDYESGPLIYTVIFSVTDSTTTATGTLTINVADVNEHSPVISSTSITGSIEEEKPVGTTVAITFSVTDADTNDVLEYSLSVNSYFSILSSTGTISTSTVLDRDTAASTTYNIVLMVSDGTHTSTATLTINLTDVNDNAPVFGSSFYTGSVAENSASGTSVASILATDADDGVNKVFNYAKISGDPSSMFSIAGNDIVTTSVPVNYETDTSFTLVITATDTGSSPLTGTTTVQISVSGVNECIPTWDIFTPAWTSASTPFDISENVAIGTTVVTIKATDLDSGLDGDITYEIDSITTGTGTGSTTGLFRLDSVTGILSTIGTFDFENTDAVSYYDIVVKAKDTGSPVRSIVRTVRVGLTDFNDNEPVFTPASTTKTILETSPVGTSVYEFIVTDADSTSTYIFNIASGDTGGYFEFHSSSTNKLQLKSVIDLDSPTSASDTYNLQITVTDGRSPELTGTAYITVSVASTNEHTPTFTPASISVIVSESESIGYTLATVLATDSDYGEDGEVEYSIFSGNTDTTFRVDSSQGYITLMKTLDYETTQAYVLEIQAKDGGDVPKVATSTVSVAVSGVNDNEPSCTPMPSISVLESASIGDTIATLSCNDADIGTTLTYSIAISQFVIDTSGIITLGAAIDYDSATQSYSFDVTVSDSSRSTTVGIIVAVTAVNEHTPSFTDVTSTVAENLAVGTSITVFTAIDIDYSPHDITSYTISSVSNSGSDKFTIDATSGEIKLSKALDYDTITTKYYEIIVVAIDGGVLQGTGTVTVSVTDVNDNTPSCLPALHVLSIAENTIPSVIIADLVCLDADSGTNGDLGFTLSQTPGTSFSLLHSGSTVSLKLIGSLDYETVRSYTLTVVVVDSGTTALSTTVSIDISVTDVNDGGPSFSGTYTVSLHENTAIASDIQTVTATDPDNADSPFGNLIYSIISGDIDNKFTIDSSSGQISVNGELDRETTENYLLIIQAIEQAGTNSASTTVNIIVLDVNDNIPSCSTMSFSIEIDESTPTGTNLQVLSCSDNDSATYGTLTYTFSSGDTTVLELSSNILKLKTAVDFESGTTSYDMIINVSDGTNVVTVIGTVRVNAVNEYTPKYTDDSNNITISETVSIGTILYTFSATDDDTGDYGTLRYYISGNVAYSEFLLDEYTGQLTVWSALDYDIAPTEYNITVQAIDKGYNASDSLSDYMWLYIVLTDENDHTPSFSQNVYTFTIYENVPSDYSVGNVVASDGDSGNNGKVAYSIVSGDGSTTFTVTETTGKIMTLSTIDYELKTLYSVVIEAKDNGTTSLSSRCLVKVVINDLNDNAPSFQPDDFAINIFENITVGTSVTSMYAVDADSSVSNNNVFTYITDSDTFVIDPSTGIITTTSTLDRENIPSYTLSITAVDQGTPATTGTATVTILIDDVNDNDPVIYGTYQVSVDENSGINTVVTTVNATDGDSDVNSQLTFSIVSGNTDSDLKIDASMGLIQIANSLDRERTSSYVLGVDVMDGGTPVRTSSVDVSISISDINDNGPIFTSVTFSFSVAEDVTVGYNVGTVTATDADTGNNGDISYSIPIFWLGINSHFSISESTGIISTAGILDRETHETYNIMCRISDNGSPIFTNAVNITILITDVNDNDPVFNASSYSASFPENEATGTKIMSVFVTDIDSGVNQDVTLTIDTANIEGQTANTYIALNSTSMTLSVKQNIDREMTPTFQFTLVATDGGSASRSSTTSISFIVEDLNDNSPSFTSSFYNFEIPYNDDCHVTVGVVAASDSDYADTVLYYITTIEHSSIFSLNSSSGVITLTSTPLENTKYELDILASDTELNNGTTKVRVDTFESESVMVTFTLGISQVSFEPLEETFISQLDSVIQQNYTNSQTHKWCIKETSVSIIDLSVYVLEDNSTDSVSNVAQNKTFLSATTVRSLLTTSNGSVALTGSLWDQFNISSITSFTASSTSAPSSSADEKWIESTTGIAVLCTIIALVIIGVVATICLVKAFRSPKIKSQAEMIKEKRKAFKVEEEDLTKPVVVAKPTMKMENDGFDDDKTPFPTSSRKGTAQTIKSTGSIVSRKNPFRRNIMLVDNMKVENVDKFYDEIDKSKLASPVIVRGPMPKIEKNTYYKEVDFWNSMVPPNAITITNTVNRRHTQPSVNKVERSTVTRYLDPASGHTMEYDTKTNTRRVVADDKN